MSSDHKFQPPKRASLISITIIPEYPSVSGFIAQLVRACRDRLKCLIYENLLALQPDSISGNSFFFLWHFHTLFTSICNCANSTNLHFDNGSMEMLKCHAILWFLIFILKCSTKVYLINSSSSLCVLPPFTLFLPYPEPVPIPSEKNNLDKNEQGN